MQAYIQQKLKEKGFGDAIIRHRLQVSLTTEQNKATNPINFYDTSGNLLYHQNGQYSNAIYPKLDVAIGKGYYKGNQLINQPFNFSEKTECICKISTVYFKVFYLIMPYHPNNNSTLTKTIAIL